LDEERVPRLMDMHHVNPLHKGEKTRSIAEKWPFARDGEAVELMNPVDAIGRPVCGKIRSTVREEHRSVPTLIHDGDEVMKRACHSPVDKPERFSHMEDLHDGSWEVGGGVSAVPIAKMFWTKERDYPRYPRQCDSICRDLWIRGLRASHLPDFRPIERPIKRPIKDRHAFVSLSRFVGDTLTANRGGLTKPPPSR
jgi:hypothetical protein